MKLQLEIFNLAKESVFTWFDLDTVSMTHLGIRPDSDSSRSANMVIFINDNNASQGQ